MAEIFASAIPLVQPDATGVHLSWCGPPTCLHSPAGWTIERRVHQARAPSACERINIGRINRPEVRVVQLGTLVLSPGVFPVGGSPGTVCTFEIARPAGGLHGTIRAAVAVLAGYRHGKAVVALGPLTGEFELGPQPIDRLVIHLADTNVDTNIDICRREHEHDDWSTATLVAERQLPIKELMPGLADEFSEAKSRLVGDDTIDPGHFAEVADLLRPLAAGTRGSILVRQEPDDDFDEMGVFDPIRMMYSSPLWRRALGFSVFDDDPALAPGQLYDYRISASFPSARRVIGFHTIPTGTQLPDDFFLYDCRVRLPAPTVVTRSPAVLEAGQLVATRRGIVLHSQSALPWITTGIEGTSAVIDLPFPTKVIQFELAPGHDLEVQAGIAWADPTAMTVTVPPGPDPVVTLPSPATHLRLRGKGFLCAVLIEPESPAPEDLVLPAVRLVDTPLPVPPVSAAAASLQRANSLVPAGSIRPLMPLGIEVSWEPAAMSGWTLPGGGPPLEASYFALERRVEPAGPWEPVLGDDDPVLGSIDEPPTETAIFRGADLMLSFPEVSAQQGGTSQFSHRDTFLKGPDGEAEPSQPEPGTMLRYRIAAIDTVGRRSASATETAPVRLEKHEAPPVPAGADTRSTDQLPAAALSGVTAKVLVKGADLTAEEIRLLDTSDNTIVLEWGWHANERLTDPFARHFRIYLASPLDTVACELNTVNAVSGQPGVFKVTATLERAIDADAAKGQYLDAGYAFFIEGHSGGTAVQLTLSTRVPAPGGGFHTPTTGHTNLPLNYSNRFTRPGGWSERLLPVIPITVDERYRFILRDRLQLTEAHPRDALWIGVSAADDQSYVPDTFAGTAGLPGNESAIAGVLCQARKMVRPSYTPPPPAADAQRIVVPEPGRSEIRFRVDFAPHMAGAGLSAADPLLVERVDANDLLRAYRVSGGTLVGTFDDETEPVSIPNPQDLATITDHLAAGTHESLPDRYLVLLAALHPFRDRLFRAVTERPITGFAFDETLPVTASRHVYRFRKTNNAGQASPEGFVPPVIVRVPSMSPGPKPVKEVARSSDPDLALRFRVTAAEDLSHVLVFRASAAVPASGELVRVPDRTDLHPSSHLRLVLADRTVLVAQAISAADLEENEEGFTGLVLQSDPSIGPERVWAVSTTQDGMPSALAGPWRIAAPYPGLAMAELTVTALADVVRFSWTWPTPASRPVVVETSEHGGSWTRVSAPMPTGTTTFQLAGTTGPRRYRLRSASTTSNEVTVP